MANARADDLLRAHRFELEAHSRWALDRIRSAAYRGSRLLSRSALARRDAAPIETITNLARHHRDWVRPVEGWVCADASHRMLASLCAHLMARYPVPAFLSRVWRGPAAPALDRWRRWYRAHGAGRPIRSLGVPVALARRMEHLFLQSPDNLDVLPALRRAEVLGLGGTEALARAVLRTRLATDFDHGEAWRAVLRFLVRHQAELRGGEVEDLVDYVHRHKFEAWVVATAAGPRTLPALDPEFSLRGRTMASMRRRLEAWRSSRRIARRARGWAPSGIHGATWAEDEDLHRVWEIVELTDGAQLHAEGGALRHCVGLYASVCRRGSSAIFSLRRWTQDRPRSVLTIEVEPARRRIVQARGFANLSPRPTPRRIMHWWAMQEGLTLDY